MSASTSSSRFNIGDCVRVKGRSKHQGRVGIVKRICPVKIGVTLPGETALVYYMPGTLQKDKSPVHAGGVTVGTEDIIGFDKLLAESYLAGYKILGGVTKGRSKSDSLILINALLQAWKDSSEEIVGGEA